MNKAVLLTLTIFAGSAMALDYQSALTTHSQRPTVVSAQLKLQDAKRQLQQTEADPLALRLDLLKARQNLELSQAELQLASIRACSEISSAYTRVLDAQAQVKLAEESLSLAEKGLEVARLRLKKGGASQQDVLAAEINLQEAKNHLAVAKDGATLARSQLVSLLGKDAEKAELKPAPVLKSPPLKDLFASLAKHPDWLKPHQAVALASAAYDLLDPSYAAPSQIDGARVNLERAQEGAAEAERGLKLRLEQRWNDVAGKQKSVDLAAKKLHKAKDDFDVAQKRYEAGLISELALRQAALQQHRAQLEYDAAEHALLAADWALFEAAAWIPEICDAQ